MRNHRIDYLKFICAVMVVCVHVQSPVTVCLQPVLRCAVPIFFMLSGYFLNYHSNGLKIRKQIRYIGKILLLSTLLYIPLSVATTSFDCAIELFSWEKIIRILLLNENPFGFHLWYLQAYIYIHYALYTAFLNIIYLKRRFTLCLFY